MQDITKAKCDSNSIPVGTEGRLIDKRDNKVYWVAKLKDGLCWMTQNLDYDGGGTMTKSWATNDTVARYYDPGAYVYTEPTNGNNRCDVYDAINCPGWKKVNALTLYSPEADWYTTADENFYGAVSYMSADGKMLCNKEKNSYFGDMDADYLPCRIYYPYYNMEELHYLVGNYYNWYAATDGTGNTNNTSGSVTGSICPTGWGLPLSGDANNTVTGSFYKLLNGYSQGAQVTVSPYYLLYGGYFDVQNTNLMDNLGYGGYYWSATIYTNLNRHAYTLSIRENEVYPTSGSNTAGYCGNSVRCVAR